MAKTRMRADLYRRLTRFLLASVIVSLAVVAWLPAMAAETEAANEGASMQDDGIADRARGFTIPFTDPRRGRELFVGKGCVICHSVNGVGGEVGPALDADPAQRSIDAFEFAARMWRGASTMIVLQEMGLGYQIELTGEELAHIARFIADPEAQGRFSEGDIPDLISDWMVDDTYMEIDRIMEELEHIAE